MGLLENKEIRQKQIEILDSVVEFCTKNNLQYFLCGGTLLGAVRHKGYIPWDDDIDIMMLRDDYTRLIEEFSLPNLTLLSHTKFKDYYYPFVKISDNNTIIEETKFTAEAKQMGVNIDIFPIDNMPNNTFYRHLWVFKMKFIRKCLRQKRYRFNRKIIESTLRTIARIALIPFSLVSLCKKLTKEAQRYNKQESTHKGIIIWGYGYREVCPKQVYQSTVKVEFENKFYNAPSGYDTYLRCVYGDYMQLPPERKRHSGHKFAVYSKY